jgi:hypothetical protein
MDLNLISGIIGAIIGALATGVFEIYRDQKKDERQKRDDQIRATNTLRGRKSTMLQSHASYYSAFIQAENLSSSAQIESIRYVDYDHILPLRSSGKPNELEEAQQYINHTIASEDRKSLTLKEGLRQKQRYEELQQEIAKHDEQFWTTIGQIKILFPNDKVAELVEIIKSADENLGKLEKEIIESIKPTKSEIDTKPSSIKLNAEREIWYTKIDRTLDVWVNVKDTALRSSVDFFDSKIEDLLNYSENILKNPQYCRDCNLFCSTKICPLKPPSQEEAKKMG